MTSLTVVAILVWALAAALVLLAGTLHIVHRQGRQLVRQADAATDQTLKVQALEEQVEALKGDVGELQHALAMSDAEVCRVIDANHGLADQLDERAS